MQTQAVWADWAFLISLTTCTWVLIHAISSAILVCPQSDSRGRRGNLSCLCNALWNLEARPMGTAVGSPQTNEVPLSGGAGERLCSEAYRPGPAWIQSCILHGVTGRHQKVSHSAQHTQKVNGGGLAVWCRNLEACRSFGGSQSSTCEVKWALEIITTNKAGGGDGIPAELFQTLKDNVVRVLHWIHQEIWKTQQWPQDWKRSVFIPILKQGNANECSNYHTPFTC